MNVPEMDTLSPRGSEGKEVGATEMEEVGGLGRCVPMGVLGAGVALATAFVRLIL